MFVDFHTHIHMYDKDEIEDIIKYYEKNFIFAFSNSLDPDSYKNSKILFEDTKNIYPTFGIHPWKADEPFDIDLIKKYLDSSLLVGEVGMDNLWTSIEESLQKKVFEIFLNYCNANEVTMTIHTKDAEETIANMMEDRDYRFGVIHWYSGDENTFNRFLNLDCYFTISPEIINNRDYIRKYPIPLDRILIETDNPGAYEWATDLESDYGDIKKIYQVLAEELGIELNQLKKQIISNLEKLLCKSTRGRELLEIIEDTIKSK